MGRDITYEDEEFWIWSTVVDEYIAGPFATPHAVGEYFMNEYLEIPEEARSRRGGYGGNWSPKKVYNYWKDNAENVMMNPEEGLTLVASLDSSTGKLTKYSEPVRMTPKLRDLKKRED